MIGYYDENPVINPEEVEDWKWMAIDDVKDDMQASGNLHRMV
jgi:isopentenyl-diphosphate delta-isomerase